MKTSCEHGYRDWKYCEKCKEEFFKLSDSDIDDEHEDNQEIDDFNLTDPEDWHY